MSVIARTEPKEPHKDDPRCTCGSTAVIDKDRHDWRCARRLWIERNEARDNSRGAVQVDDNAKDLAMSGGSFNYLCHKDASDLLTGGLHDAQDMATALAALGYAQDAAEETFALIAAVNAAQAQLDALIERVQPVWKAMEWWQSCDWGENDLKRALAEYRGVELPTCSRCAGTGRERDSAHACKNRGCCHGKDVAGV